MKRFRFTYVEVSNGSIKLFEMLFARVHACDPGSIPGRDMFVSGALVEDGDDLGQVSS